MYGRGKKLSKPKTQHIKNPFIFFFKKIKIMIIRDIWTLFVKKKEKRNYRKEEELIRD